METFRRRAEGAETKLKEQEKARVEALSKLESELSAAKARLKERDAELEAARMAGQQGCGCTVS